MNKHFVLLPDGRKATRSSQNRTYTHAVATRRSAAAIQSQFRSNADHLLAEAAKYRSGYNPVYKEDLFAKWGTEKVIGWAVDCEARALAAQEAAENTVEDGPWGVAGWCGRYDLAVKLEATWAKNGYDTIILVAGAN